MDTSLFPADFQARVLSALSQQFSDGLDAHLNGTLIHADNFQALNLLQARYREQVKCIYIDPPYNTEKDRTDGKFIYKDGYPHSTWLSLMYSRIELSVPFLAKNSSFLASIDDNEVMHLKHILNQQKELNFIGSIAWEAKTKSQNTKDSFDKLQPKVEYILTYSTQEKARFNLIEKGKKEYPLQDEKGSYRSFKLEPMSASGMRGRESMIFPILGIYPPTGKQWQIGQEMADEFEKRGDIYIENGSPFFKMRPDDERNEITEPFWAFIDKTIGTAESAKGNLKQIIPSHRIETVKPYTLIQKLSYHTTSKTSLILDYFAGSGTTAHAVINLNREDGGNRHYILVEQGEYFDTVLKPRVQKVIYSENWKDGKPVPSENGGKAGAKLLSDGLADGLDRGGQAHLPYSPYKGVSQIVKVLKLESYEDTLNNLALHNPNRDLFGHLPESAQSDYVLRYMLDVESRASLLNVSHFAKPFDYKMDIAEGSAGAGVRRKVDLVETFNYLLGLTVVSIDDRRFDRGYVMVTGRLPQQSGDDNTLIVWRDCERWPQAEDLFGRLRIHPQNTEFAAVYLNGDHTLTTAWSNENGESGRLKIRQTEAAFLDLMFAEVR